MQLDVDRRKATFRELLKIVTFESTENHSKCFEVLLSLLKIHIDTFTLLFFPIKSLLFFGIKHFSLLYRSKMKIVSQNVSACSVSLN